MKSPKVLFLYPNEPFLNPPPVGIGILNALLRNHGIETAIFDTTFYKTSPLSSDKAKEENLQVRPFNFSERGISANEGDMCEELREMVRSYRPDIVMLSVLEPTYALGSLMLEIVREENPESLTVVGGVFPTAAPELLIMNPSIDILCIGEGEGPVLDLVTNLANGTDYRNIQNLWVKHNGSIVRNPIRQVVSLDELPMPDYSIFDDRRFYRPMAGNVYRAVPIETNRGCPYGCTFCNSPATLKLYREHNAGAFFRKKSMKNIEAELQCLTKKWNAEFVYFLSDTFLAMNDREFDQFIEIYGKISLPFWMQTRPETVTQERAIRLKEVGCLRVSMGLEHGNEQFRKHMLMKPYKNEQMIDAAECLKNAGIPLSVNNIIGFPDETRELIFDTIELNRQLTFDTTNAYAFTPFRGTELYAYCLQKGYVNEEDLAGCLTKDTMVSMPQLSPQEILGLMRTFSLYARMPKEYWERIRIAESFDEKGNQEFEELSALYTQMFFNN